MPRPLVILSLLVAANLAQAEVPSLLHEAVDKWIGERDQWAFTQFVREFAGGAVREERLERYDPSQPGELCWRLLAVNGRPPTPERRAEWQRHKMKKRLNPGKPLGGFLDFAHATVADETAERVRYHLPLRKDYGWLFPVDRVNLKVSVNKATHAIDKIEAGIDEPFRIALGLGRVLDLDFDVQMNPAPPGGEKGGSPAVRPAGTATAALNRLGERIEYAWSQFERVTPHPDNAVVPGSKR